MQDEVGWSRAVLAHHVLRKCNCARGFADNLEKNLMTTSVGHKIKRGWVLYTVTETNSYLNINKN